jgi:hypothetical protein
MFGAGLFAALMVGITVHIFASIIEIYRDCTREAAEYILDNESRKGKS